MQPQYGAIGNHFFLHLLHPSVGPQVAMEQLQKMQMEMGLTSGLAQESLPAGPNTMGRFWDLIPTAWSLFGYVNIS